MTNLKSHKKPTLSKLNFYLDQYRQKNFLPNVENENLSNKDMVKRFTNIDEEKLKVSNNSEIFPNPWFDIWGNFWVSAGVGNINNKLEDNEEAEITSQTLKFYSGILYKTMVE